MYYLRIPRDCNGNGIEDDCDVTCGAPGTRCDVPGCGLFADCNGNATPDVCEPNIDCNNNTVADICDIANHTSQDCNFNQVPDECESAPDCNNEPSMISASTRFLAQPSEIKPTRIVRS